MWKKFAILMVLFSVLWAVPASAADQPYKIDVNLTQNIVTVYSKDESGAYTVPVKAFVCSVGYQTPTGTYNTTAKYEWRPLFGNVYGQYATRITGSILFHSVPYFEEDKSTLEYLEYNKLGTTASMGCVRLTVEDVKWIYDNCPIGTTVTLYKSNEIEPLVPQEPQKIDIADERRGWDPTDPDENNPWNKEKIVDVSTSNLGIVKHFTMLQTKADYAITANDARVIFGYFGIALSLPSNLDGVETRYETLYKRVAHQITIYRENGVVFYSLSDLADMTGVTINENLERKEVVLGYSSLWRWVNDIRLQIRG